MSFNIWISPHLELHRASLWQSFSSLFLMDIFVADHSMLTAFARGQWARPLWNLISVINQQRLYHQLHKQYNGARECKSSEMHANPMVINRVHHLTLTRQSSRGVMFLFSIPQQRTRIAIGSEETHLSRKAVNCRIWLTASFFSKVNRSCLYVYPLIARVVFRPLPKHNIASSHSVFYSANFTANYDLLEQIIDSNLCAFFFALGQRSNRGIESCQEWNNGEATWKWHCESPFVRTRKLSATSNLA